MLPRSVYISDISGAFDRVFSPFLLAKLRRAGVSDVMLQLLTDYLNDRTGVTLVNRIFSNEFVLNNMVYQGSARSCTMGYILLTYTTLRNAPTVQKVDLPTIRQLINVTRKILIKLTLFLIYISAEMLFIIGV